MMSREHMRAGAQFLAAIFGGPGLFYLWLSFYRPEEALTAILYLSIATAITLTMGEPEREPARVGAFARTRRAIHRRFRRR
ncbi:MAG TPA: hypothetical protein VLX85_05710 [Stellaceae bacterium]|nr:hypothetical protein [Stellaceae bacterium]